MNDKCPICNKAGLPDYTTTTIICPQCNSDLKPFFLLHSISKPQISKISTYIITGISLLSIAFLGLFLNSNFDRKELIVKNELLNDSIFKMGSINFINKEKGESQPTIEKRETTIKYVVKKGDYPYKIAHFFYGVGSKYKQIEIENNLEQPYTLKVGQILTIKIAQE